MTFDGVGTDSALRRELEKVMDAQERRSGTIPFYMPVREIVAAAHRAFTDVPRVPDYDDEVARKQVWCTDPEPVERGDLPAYDEVRVRAENGFVVMTVLREGQSEEMELVFEPDAVEGFFLAGLSAMAQARRERSAGAIDAPA